MKISKSVVLGILAVLFLLANGGIASADEGWETSLTISVLQARNKLSFGQRSDATDGIDGQYDVPAMLSGDMKASFVANSGKYWRDIRSFSDAAKTWNLRIESPVLDTVIIAWKPSLFPAGKKAFLLDAKKNVLADMTVNSEYRYQNEGAAEFLIEVALDKERQKY